MNLQIRAAVGHDAPNTDTDVGLVQALLNIFLSVQQMHRLRVDAIAGEKTLAAIADFQSQYVAMQAPDRRVDAKGRTFKALLTYRQQHILIAENALYPAQGALTFSAEGQEGGPYHSRVLHVPTAFSGITLGRGYDLKLRKHDEVLSTLLGIGIREDVASILAKGVGIKGREALCYIINHDLLDFSISPEQQVTLFESVYLVYCDRAKYLCSKADVERHYGACDWDGLNPVIREIIVDMTYRGDYTPQAREIIQSFVSGNDIVGLRRVLEDKEQWRDFAIPSDRYQRRLAWLSGSDELSSLA